MIERELTSKIRALTRRYPVVSLTGPRQSGKSTLLRHLFPDYRYLSLEDVSSRQAAAEDPKGFLAEVGQPLVIDEAQYVPELFSYLQLIVDEKNQPGQYLLSGSQNFLLLKNIAQSLAGRVGIAKLLPFSYRELTRVGRKIAVPNLVFTGGYPRIYQMKIKPDDFYADYTTTYLEKDINTLLKIKDVRLFRKFLGLCAARVGQILNVASLAGDCGVKVETVQSWLSILEASYILFFLPPYYTNLGKRLIKSPKLYFFDTGLACNLSHIRRVADLKLHPLYGNLFENLVVSEYVKSYYNQRVTPELYFWRDSNKNEVDLVNLSEGKLELIEIKNTQTAKQEAGKTVNAVGDLLGVEGKRRKVIYIGEVRLKIGGVTFEPFERVFG